MEVITKNSFSGCHVLSAAAQAPKKILLIHLSRAALYLLLLVLSKKHDMRRLTPAITISTPARIFGRLFAYKPPGLRNICEEIIALKANHLQPMAGRETRTALAKLSAKKSRTIFVRQEIRVKQLIQGE